MSHPEGTSATLTSRDKCKKCGECCRHIHILDGDRIVMKLDKPCPMLRGDLCSIYNNRPWFCMSGDDMKRLNILPDNCGYKED